MPSQSFEKFLADLGQRLQLTLSLAEDESANLKLPDGTQLQFTESEDHSTLVVRSPIGTPPPGASREGLFRAALHWNHKRPPRFGTFAYSRSRNFLMLYDSWPMERVHVDQVLDELAEFSHTASQWVEHLQRGTLPEVEAEVDGAPPKRASEGGPGLFGLRP